MSNGNVFVMLPLTIILLYCGIMVSAQANGSVSSEGMDVAHICNNSFSIPSDYIVQFNRNGDLPEIVDKTGMCFIRCYFEKAGLLKNWQLNKGLIMQTMWPIKADSIAICEPEASKMLLIHNYHCFIFTHIYIYI
uniref:Pheromone-binding protein-related protein 4 n=1 Tax=Bactrocera dorsalis TaxID=27457 RepID=A0A034WTG5_BACDO